MGVKFTTSHTLKGKSNAQLNLHHSQVCVELQHTTYNAGSVPGSRHNLVVIKLQTLDTSLSI